MPDLVIAKIGWKRIWFSVGKDNRADRVGESARNEQGHGSRAELVVDGADEKDDDPAHEQETDIRHQYGNFCEEDGFQRNKENRQTPDDPKQHPARRSAEDGETEGGVRPCNEDVNGIMVKDAEDAQIFIKEQKEMQEATEQE